jgi:hypothetical protein
MAVPFVYMPDMHGGILVYPLDPDAHVVYEFDYSDWLVEGETITLAEALTSSGLVVATPQIDGPRVQYPTQVLEEHGRKERLTSRVTTNAAPPRVDDRSIIIPIRER